MPLSDQKIPVEIPISGYSSSIIQQNTGLYTVQYGLYTTVQKYSFLYSTVHRGRSTGTAVDLTCTSARRAPYPAANHDDRPHRGGGTPSSIIIGAPPPPEPAANNPFLPRRQAR